MKKLLYLVFILFVLLMSWDVIKQDMAIAASNNNIIPDEAIRLRIIANSDSPEDQWLKRKVRDIVIDELNVWSQSVNDISEARTLIDEQIPNLQQLVEEAVRDNGFPYSEQVRIELGSVPFPTKMYGNIVYPAGDYEALRITLGSGQGQNWWCVLFPPLCFVDMSTGDAVQQSQIENNEPSGANKNAKVDDVEVRFFLFDLFLKVISFFKSML